MIIMTNLHINMNIIFYYTFHFLHIFFNSSLGLGCSVILGASDFYHPYKLIQATGWGLGLNPLRGLDWGRMNYFQCIDSMIDVFIWFSFLKMYHWLFVLLFPDRNFNTNSNNIQSRVTQIYVQALSEDRISLATKYGSVAGLGELGPEVSISRFHVHHHLPGQRRERNASPFRSILWCIEDSKVWTTKARRI